MSKLGVDSVEIGNSRIDVKEQADPRPSLSNKWSQHITAGGELYILEVSNAYSGYAGDEHVDPENYTIDDLVDQSIISNLAPKAVVFDPKQETPWRRALGGRGFQLWITSQKDLAVLWGSMDQWVRKEWHDKKLDELRASGKIPHKWDFESVACVNVSKILAPDLDLRIARHERAMRMTRAVEQMGGADREAQEALKRAIGGLVGAENHPVLGEQVSKIIENLLPGLAMVMDGKQRYKNMEAEERKLRIEIHQAYRKQTVKYTQRPVNPPVF